MTFSAIIIGAGDATGGAIAKRIAREGLPVCVVRRSAEALEPLAAKIEGAGGRCLPMGADARKEEDVVSVFDRAEAELGPLDLAVFNIGANVRFPFTEIEERKFRKIWELACFAGFLTAREAARRMVPRGRGTILLTGASAGVKGYAGGAAFASAKFALRGMAQAMARELGPKGVHVAHIVVDGAIDTAFIRETFPEMYAKKSEDGILNPDHIAEEYWRLYRQPRDAWTHELDLRPWMESF
ncbi:MAG: SDR family oxidoreductase [Pseudomonadota bacterium]